MAESAQYMHQYYRLLWDGISPKRRFDTGWGMYGDTQYTVSNPFVVTQGTRVTLPNNKGNLNEDYLPQVVNSFYDGTKITPAKVGDAMELSFRFKVKSSVANGAFSLSIDIGGALGTILEDTRRLVRGANIEHFYNISFTAFTLDTFLANGGTVKFNSITGDSSVYDISYVLVRTHAAPPVLGE